ncbi:MAG: MFS transporter [Candidatus Kapabacteria bacterium]|nr:MFS transporter [Candidatus Kapabacteria bacterium]
MNLIQQLKQFNKYFWLYNLLQVLERIATWVLIIQLPIFIAQKGVNGGLEFEQYQKGIIYFFWAFSQNFTTIFVGGIADKYGKQKVMKFALIAIILSLINLSFQRNFYLFTISLAILGVSSGFFKPALQGKIAQYIKIENSGLGWGIYVWLINLSIFVFGTPLAKYLKDISWQWIFLGSAIVFAINFITLLMIKDIDEKDFKSEQTSEYIKRIFKGIIEPKILFFVLPIAGFTLIYMQFYETLPNYIYDWVPTSDIIKYFNINSIFTSNDSLFGNRVSYEWLYSINTGVIILLLIPFAYMFSKVNKILVITLGLLITIIGFSFCGLFANGYYLVFGIIIYTIGEMIVNPKICDYMSSIAPSTKKSQYIGYLSLAWTVGLSFGGLLGGFLYGAYGEREALAKQELIANNTRYNINSSYFEQYANSINKSERASVDDVKKLYQKRNPFRFFYIFIVIGLISLLGLIIYWRRYAYT